MRPIHRVLVHCFVFALVLAFVPPLSAQPAAAGGAISGKVVTAGGAAVPDATVEVVGTRRRAATDATGAFHIDGLAPGRYLLQVDSPRFGSGTAEVTVAVAEVPVEIALDFAIHHEEILVTGSPDARRLEESYQPADVLDSGDLQAKLQPTLGETLAQQPGVSSTAFGQGASRPVVRGFEGDRIRILDNGVGSGDVSDTSPDHAVSMDPFSADRIEVLRGPATLMYGSSAEGGVINVLSDRIPSQVPLEPLAGRIDLRAGSVSNERAGAANLGGGHGHVGWHLDGFKRDADDYKSGEGTVLNSYLEAKGGSGGVSYVSDSGYLGASASRFDTNYGNPAEEVVHLELSQKRYDVQGELYRPDGFLRGLKGRFGHNDYEHTEFEGDEVGTKFLDNGSEGRLEALHRAFGPVTGSFGVQVKKRNFEAIGEEAFVPPTSTDNWAAFLFEEVGSGPFRAQLGLRHDKQDTSADAPDLPDRNFSATSASLGGLYVQGDYAAALTVSRSVKLPNAVELYANGPHIATLAFEIGDPNLDEEKSLGVDLSLRKTAGRAHGELSLFANRIDGFIFEQFTAEEPPEEFPELVVIRFTQRDAEFRGAEAHLDVDLLHAEPHHVTLELGADFVRASLRDTGEPLPRIPPRRFLAGLRYQGDKLGAGVEARKVDRQDRVGANETETSGYTLVNAQVSYRLFSDRLVHDLVLRGTNLTDELARNHVSFLKDVAPLPGRDVSLSYRLTF